jgi:hypothetical protein
MSGGTLIEWVWCWIASMGTPAAMRPMTGTEMAPPHPGRCRQRAAALLAGAPALDHAGRELAAGERPGRHGFGQADDFQRAGAVGEAADEAALLQRRDQAVDAGFRARSSASFISSKEGGMPVSFMR